MGWESRRYEPPDESRGGFPALLRRMFGQGEDFYGWGITLYRAWGIDVRIHLLFIIYIVVELIRALPKDNVGVGYRSMALASLFMLVLLHEYGHCIACRRIGGTANRIVLWPLGGLASCMPPPNWRANLITTVGGPAVNLLLFPVFAGILLALGVSWTSILFNPFAVDAALGDLYLPRTGSQPYWLYWLWWLHATNAFLFLFNVLIPMFPMDSGRILHCLLWRKLGHRRATDIATKIGFAVAAVLVVIASVGEQHLLMGIAVFGIVECWQARRRLAMEQGDPALGDYDFDRGHLGFPPDDEDPRETSRQARARERRQQEAEAEQAELDRILAKIARSGMGSLTRAEKRWLERATEQRRRG